MPDRLILASASPRRAELLTQAGIPFEVDPAHVDESVASGDPHPIVQELAKKKALTVASRRRARLGPDAVLAEVVLGADTIVVVDREVLGKPADPDDAARMLERLSGRTHGVYGGFYLTRADGRFHLASDHTTVEFRKLSEREIAAYAASGEPLDKAGAYAIQGGAAGFVTRIIGSYTNVVGLHLANVIEALADLSDIEPFSPKDRPKDLR